MTAAPDAGTLSAEDAALEALRLDYGHVYDIGCGEGDDWHASRRDGKGGRIEERSPDSLRQAMAEDHEFSPVRLWCAHCGRRVVFAAGAAVHAATLSQTGPDGHAAGAVASEPPLWRAARQIAADYRGAFTVEASYGNLRATWTREALRALGERGTSVRYTARNSRDPEADLRRQLDEAVAGTRWERAAEETGR